MNKYTGSTKTEYHTQFSEQSEGVTRINYNLLSDLPNIKLAKCGG